MIKEKHVKYSLGRLEWDIKFLQRKKFVEMVITRIENFKEFLDDGFVRKFFVHNI